MEKYTVYKITNNDGLEYIGQTSNLKHRIRKHITGALRKKVFACGYNVEIIAEFKTREEALALEEELVTTDYLNLPTTLNRREGGNTNSFKGKKRPEHSELMKNKPNKGVGHLNTEEVRAKSRASRQTAESREKSRKGAKGNTNVRGRKWYNNGIKSFMLPQDDPRIKLEGLLRGRIKW